MSNDPLAVNIQIMDKEYRIACPPEEQDALITAAHYLNDRIREIRESGKVIGGDRIAVMAALNITHELLEHKKGRENYAQSMGSRIKVLQDKIESAISNGQQLEF